MDILNKATMVNFLDNPNKIVKDKQVIINMEIIHNTIIQ